jgi:hypothetical protein
MGTGSIELMSDKCRPLRQRVTEQWHDPAMGTFPALKRCAAASSAVGGLSRTSSRTAMATCRTPTARTSAGSENGSRRLTCSISIMRRRVILHFSIRTFTSSTRSTMACESVRPATWAAAIRSAVMRTRSSSAAGAATGRSSSRDWYHQRGGIVSMRITGGAPRRPPPVLEKCKWLKFFSARGSTETSNEPATPSGPDRLSAPLRPSKPDRPGG